MQPTPHKITAKRISQAGFTLVELLVVIAITGILTVSMAVMTTNHLQNMDLRKLDNAAREIYMAAQNRATKMQSMDNLQKSLKKLPSKVGSGDARYFRGTDYESTAIVESLLPKQALNPTLLKGDFYVVYAPDGSGVTDVFYSEEPISTAFADLWNNHSLDYRLNNKIGYYGIGSSGAGGGGATPVTPASPVIDASALRTPYVEISNGERLSARITYWEPKENAVTLTAAIEASPTDAAGKPQLVSTAVTLPTIPPGQTIAEGIVMRQVEITDIDKIPGVVFDDIGNFSLVARVALNTGSTDLIKLENSGFARSNGLFAEVSNNTAYVSNLRHLQNIEWLPLAYLVDGIVLTNDIDCSSTQTPGNEFRSIVFKNDRGRAEILRLFDGQGFTIYNLRVKSTEFDFWGSKNGAGLFAFLQAYWSNGVWGPLTTFKDIRFENFSVLNTNPATMAHRAGALIGYCCQGGVQFSNVVVSNSKVEATPWGGIYSFAGGIVGRFENNNTVCVAQFDNCKVINTVIEALQGYAGGFVGIGDFGDGQNLRLRNSSVRWEPELTARGGGASFDAVNNFRSMLIGSNGLYSPKISGVQIGGLVGSVNGVSISKCFVATALSAKDYAGGLVGITKSNVKIDSSYSDCYIKPEFSNSIVSGMVAYVSSDSGASVSLNNCYIAGYIESPYQSTYYSDCGNITPDSLNVYSAMARTFNGVYASAYSWDASSEAVKYDESPTIKPRNNNTYFLSMEKSAASAVDGFTGTQGSNGDSFALSEAELSSGTVLDKLGSAFEFKDNPTSDSAFASPSSAWSNTYYAWPNGGESVAGVYEFPGLVGLPHYGGWWLPKGIFAFRSPNEPFYVNASDEIVLRLAPGTETGGQWSCTLITDSASSVSNSVDSVSSSSSSVDSSMNIDGSDSDATASGVTADSQVQMNSLATSSDDQPIMLAASNSPFEQIEFGFESGSNNPVLRIKAKDDASYVGTYKLRVTYSNKPASPVVFSYSTDIVISLTQR